MPKQSRPSKQDASGNVDRRAILRTTGTAVVAGVAGLAVAETISATSANAAPGGNFILGQSNDASPSTTSLTSADDAGATLALANTGSGAPLNLKEVPTPASQPPLASGDLANYGGDLVYAAGGTGGPFIGFVYTPFVANQLVPITPQRVIDTRNANSRVNITNSVGNLDAAGRLLAGHTIVVNLIGLATGATAAYCNLTAVLPLGGGFMTLWPGGPRPATSSINFTAGAIIANFAVTGITNSSTAATVSIFSAATTHVILDVTAFAVGAPSQITSGLSSTSGQAAAHGQQSAQAAAGTLPKW
jgi:hypothetical protein